MRSTYCPRRSAGQFLLTVLLMLPFCAAASAAPSLVAITPPTGTVTDAESLLLEGEVQGAVRLTVDGRRVPLENGRFRVGPVRADEGERRFLFVAEDAAGEETAWVHAVTFDRRPPTLALDPGLPSVVSSPSLRVSGAALDAHLESVTIGGQAAEVKAGRFSAEITLVPGVQRLEVVAKDSLGHESRTGFSVELDGEPPRLQWHIAGAALEDGARFRRGIVPELRATGAERVDLRLDGRPWTAGRTVTEEGSHQLQAVAVDAAGNRSEAVVSFTIDTTPPRLGRVHGAEKVLRERSFTLEGRVEGAVSVTVDGREATLDGDLYRAGPFALDGGERIFEVVATDAAGNETTAQVPVKNDPDAPTLALSAPGEGAVFGAAAITVSGTAQDVDLASVTVAVGAGPAVAAALDGDDFTAPVTLVEGSNGLTVIATDAVGHASTAERSVILDTVAPTLTVSAGGSPLVDGAVFAGLVTPEVSTVDATAVDVAATLDGLAFSPGTSVTALGSHELSITATDAAGNAASTLLTFTVEGSAPVFADLQPADGSVLSAPEVRLAGRAEGAVQLTVDGQPASLVAGDFTAGPYALAEGTRSFTLVATSAGGQTSSVTLTVTRDATPPALTFTAPADGTVGTESAATVTGTVSDAHFQTLTVNGAAATLTGDPATGATFEATVTLNEGENRLRAVAVDAAGHTTDLERRAVLDTRPPEIEILDPAAGTVVGEDTVTVSGRVADAHLDRVEIGGVVATLAGPSSARTWSAAVPLAAGAQTLTATAHDTLSHQSSATLQVVRDDAAPLVRITSPAEGLVTSAATVDVSGTVAAGATVTVGGVDAAVTGTAFSRSQVPLVEGENRLVARATAGAEQGSHVRTVVRDTGAPTVLGVSPADGSEGLPRDAVFEVTFSEPLAEPAAGAWRLETAAGAPIPATGGFDAGTLDAALLRIAPQGLLPPETEVRLVLTSQLVDRAGHALTAVTWSFHTVADGAPAPPALDALPSSLCGHTVTVSGTAPAGSIVRLDGGASSGETRAADDGSFSLDLSLLPGRLHLLEAVSVDFEGRVSASAWAEVAQDCAAPQVLSAERTGDVFTLTFDEVVDPASAAITVSDASGALAGSLGIDGGLATWTAAAALPAGVLRLEVAAGLADPAGNAMAFPWVRLFGAGDASSFLAGTVLDEATGRPLAGATATVTRSGGAPTAEPRPEMTTGTDGRFLIAAAPGTHDLTIARPGYSPVFRVVTTVAGEGTEVFTPRLEPMGGEAALDSAGGRLEAAAASGGRAVLDVPAGALAGASDAQLAVLPEQALPALLPYGWSPRGAAWVDLGTDTPPLAAATLELPVSAPPGRLLVLAALDLDSLQWRALEEQAVVASGEGTRVSFTLDPAAGFAGVGAFAALEADTGAVAPPAAVLGEVLGSSPAPSTSEVQSASLGFDPEVVLPTQTSDVTVIYSLSSEQPSGLPLTLIIQEELELIDGTLRREAPYRAQLVLYRDAEGTPSSRFRLQPSQLARSQPVRLGAEDVTLVSYADEGVRGNVLGPDGGWVLGEAGDRLEVPSGALTEPTPVVLERRTEADLPLSTPGGGTVATVLEIDLGGAELGAAASLQLALDPPPAAGSRGLLLHVVDLPSGPAYRAVAELAPTATGYETLPIDAADLPWPGVRGGGFYVALTLDFAPAFARGTVYGEDGLPLAGAIISSAAVDWIQISSADGAYVLPLPVGSAELEIEDPATGNVTTSTVTTAAADERADVDPQTTPTGPRVLSTTPQDGAEVPAGIQPQISFSEPIDPASVASGIQLLRAGQVVPVAFDVQGALVTVLPVVSLAPGAPYELRVTGGFGEGLRDLQGYSLEQAVSVGFTVGEVTLPSGIDLSKVVLFAPDAGGMAQVVGEPGAVPANNLVWVENLSSYQTTESVTSAQDGSFTLTIGAEVGDEILFHVLVEGANEVIKLLGPFMSADRKGAFVGRDAITFTTADGVSVIVGEGTFETFTQVRVEPRPTTDPPPAPWPAPGVLEPVYSFQLDFGGAEAKRPLDVRVPAPAGAQDEWYLLAKAWDFFGRPLWSMKDIMVLDGAELTTERSAAAPSGGSSLDAGALKSADPTKSSSSDPRDYKVALWSAGNFSVFKSGNPLMWAAVKVDSMAVVFTDSVPGMVIEVTDALEYVYGLQDWAVPSLLGEDFEIFAHDARTGFELFREVFEPLTEPLQILPPASLPDRGRPFLMSGDPLLMQMVAAAPGSKELLAGVEVEVSENRDGEGQLLSDQTLTVTFEQNSLVIERRPEDNAPIPIEVKLMSMVDGSETVRSVGPEIESGPVTLSRQVTLGESYLLTAGAVLRLDEWVEMQWSEALDQDLEGIELELLGGQQPLPIPATVEPMGTYERIRVRPQAGWQAGESYQLRLRGTIKDVAGNELLPFDEPGCSQSCERASVTIRLNIRAQRVFQGFDFTAVRDIERLGSLLFVAAGSQGLWVLDASDPENLVNFFGGAGSQLHFGFPLGGQVRSVAIDPHGRVVVSGGGVFGPGQVKILDPLAFPANPVTNQDLVSAWRGSTLVSNQLGGTQYTRMPPATPGHMEILSRDREDSWILGVDDSPAGLSVSPQQIPALDEVDVTVSGDDGVTGQPVSLRNLTRGTWERIDAGTGGGYSLTLKARRGDRLQVLRNTDALLYLVLESNGMAAVDLNHFYGESDDADGDGIPDDPEIVQSQVLRYYTHSLLENENGDPLCNPDGLYLGEDATFLATDFSILGRDSDGPWHLPTLVRPYGLVMIAVDGNNPVELSKTSFRCAVGRVPNPGPADIGYMTGMATAEHFEALVIYDDDAVIPAPEGAQEVEIGGQTVKVGREQRDYVFLGNTHGHIYVVDVTNRRDLRIVARIELPVPPAGPMTFDEEGQRLLVSALGNGVFVVDLGGPFPLRAINLAAASAPDVNADGDDDRVLEQIEVRDGVTSLPLNVNRRVRLWRDLGLAWIGGIQNLQTPGELGLGGLVYRAPRVRFLAEGEDGLQETRRLAPFGVPTAQVTGAAEGTEYPGLVRVEMHLPGELANAAGELRVDLVSVGPGGLEITGAGDPALIDKLPATSFRGDDGLLLKRQSDKPWHEGYQIYLSDPVLVLADLKASYWYAMTQKEKDATDTNGDLLCRRCDLFEEEVYPQTVHPSKVYRELLSGHRVAIRLPQTVKDSLADLYGPLLASQAEAEVVSVAWDISPSLEQEPFQNPSFGHGEVAPGTLLHSGEFTRDVVDLQLPGLGFDFTFARSYRNQTVGGGPLGPGWDFGYRARLRPLPDRDVDYFDGRGRRVTFQWDEGEKRFDPPPGVFMQLTRDAAGYRVKDRQGNLLRFDLHGRLLAMYDKFKLGDDSGTALAFEYDPASKLVSVSAHGRNLQFEYDEDGLLVRLMDDADRDVLFTYDAAGRLEKVKSPPAAMSKGGIETRLVTTYGYEAPGTGLRRSLNRRDNLTSIEDARFLRWLEMTWTGGDGDMGHRMASQTWGEDTSTLSFDETNDQLTLTDRRGKTHVYAHNDSGQVTYYKDPGDFETTWKYEAYGAEREQGLLTEMVLPSGRKLVYEYAQQERFAIGGGVNPRVVPINMADVSKVSQEPGPGEPSLVTGDCDPSEISTNGSGDEIAWGYSGHHAWSHKPGMVTTPTGLEMLTQFAGTSSGQGGWTRQMRTEVPTGHGGDAETQTSTTEITERDAQGRVKTQNHTTSDGKNVTTTFAYDSGGPELASPSSLSISSEGQTYDVGLNKDAVGRVTRLTEPGGVQRLRTFNAVGWLLEECVKVEGSEVCTRYTYTRAGQVEKIERPVGETGQEHVEITYDYGLLGEVKQVQTQIDPGGASGVLTENRSYDANLNLEVVDATGTTAVVYGYNDRNLQIRRTTFDDDGNGQLEWFHYNGDRQLSTYEDARGKSWRVVYDGYGRSMQTLDPELNTTWVSYDVAGRPSEHVSCDASGEALTSTKSYFDGADRLVASEKIDPNDDIPTATSRRFYDSESRLVKAIDPLGQIVDYVYDGLGRLVGMYVAGGSVYSRTWSDFDDRGNAQRETETVPAMAGNPSTYSQVLEYDAFDRPTAITSYANDRFQIAYDVRGNVIRKTTPGGEVVSYRYDGLDRMTHSSRPLGISMDYEYSAQPDASQMRVLDGLGQATIHDYDGRGRIKRVTYADNTSASYTYDAAGNRTGLTLGDGTSLVQTFDDVGRMTGRTITPAVGLEGHTLETFEYDGLHRMSRADLQGTVSTFRYDGFSRLDRDTTQGKTLSYQFDAAGQTTGITFPSSHDLTQSWDAAGHLELLQADQDLGTAFRVDYRWQGGQVGTKSILVADPVLGHPEVMSGAWDRNSGGFVMGSSFYGGGGQHRLLEEDLTRNQRGQVLGQSFKERGGMGWWRVYDDAGRLKEQWSSAFHATGVPLDGEQMKTSVPTRFEFDFDAVDNLLSMKETRTCEEKTIALPLDDSKRNRPAEVDGADLDYDSNGYLTRKGDLYFSYDYRGRLVEVKRETEPNTFEVVAEYGYDHLDRRVSRVLGHETWRTAWDGWRAVEEYLDQGSGEVLMSRRVYGARLDEIVGLEIRPTPAMPEMTPYVPLYDVLGNLVVLADGDGKPVERYDYSPFGERFIWADSTPPAVEQVLFKDGEVVLELSEEVRRDRFEQKLNATLRLRNVTKGHDIDLSLSYPVEHGRNARRRLVLSLEAPESPEDREAGDVLELTLPADAFEDFFGNRAVAIASPPTFSWQAAGLEVVLDTADPRLLDACIVGGKLRLEFSETPKESLADLAIQLDGAALEWTLLEDGYTLESRTAVAAGPHSLTFTSSAFDLADRSLPSSEPLDFDGADGHLWAAALPGEVGRLPGDRATRSAAGNPFGFKGLPVDPETGFYYVRKRYYDPELGRFLTPDPFGDYDSANLYQFALNDPANLGDPTGQYVELAWDATSLSLGVGSLVYNLIEGNYGLAAIDAGGVVLDGLATAIPFLPAGAGAALKASRAGGLLSKAHLVDQTLNIGQGIYQAGSLASQGETGWAIFYGGMSAVGLRQVKNSPHLSGRLPTNRSLVDDVADDIAGETREIRRRIKVSSRPTPKYWPSGKIVNKLNWFRFERHPTQEDVHNLHTIGNLFRFNHVTNGAQVKRLVEKELRGGKKVVIGTGGHGTRSGIGNALSNPADRRIKDRRFYREDRDNFKDNPNVKVIDVTTPRGAAEFLFYETAVDQGKLSGTIVMRAWCHSVCDIM